MNKSAAPLSLAIVGASGKMGQSLLQNLPFFPSLRLKCALVGQNSNLFNPLCRESFLTEYGQDILITSDFMSLPTDTDLMIDFSTKENFYSTLTAALSLHIPLVLGTTGLDVEMIQALQAASSTIPIFYSANFSIGMYLIQSFIEKSQNLLQDYYVDIEEVHHVSKKDLPSGTALALAKTFSDHGFQVHSETPLSRSPQDLIIHSARVPHLLPSHTLNFSSKDEIVSISHSVLSRTPYAKGALEACTYLIHQTPGLYTLDDMMNFTHPHGELSCNKTL